jgi:hypothetical protein
MRNFVAGAVTLIMSVAPGAALADEMAIQEQLDRVEKAIGSDPVYKKSLDNGKGEIEINRPAPNALKDGLKKSALECVTKDCTAGKIVGNLVNSAFSPFFKFDGGTQFNFWQPASTGITVMDYDTVGYQGFTTSVEGGLSPGHPLFRVSYSAPFDGASHQRELLEVKDKRTPAGFEKLRIWADLGGVAKEVLGSPVDEKTNDLIWYNAIGHLLASFRPDYTHQSFFGSIKANRPIALIGPGTTVQGRTLTGGITTVDPPQSVSFRTDFETWRASVDLASLNPSSPHSFRIGGFQTTYRRPTANGAPGANSYSCNGCAGGWREFIFDTTFRSRGLGLAYGFEQTDKEKDGANSFNMKFGLTFDIGISSRVTVADTDIGLYPGGVKYTGVGLTLGLDWYRPDWIPGLFFGLSGELDAHSWQAEKLLYLKDADTREQVSARIGIHL